MTETLQAGPTSPHDGIPEPYLRSGAANYTQALAEARLEPGDFEHPPTPPQWGHGKALEETWNLPTGDQQGSVRSIDVPTGPLSTYEHPTGEYTTEDVPTRMLPAVGRATVDSPPSRVSGSHRTGSRPLFAQGRHRA